MHLPTTEQVEAFAATAAAGAVAIGVLGTSIEQLGEVLSRVAPRAGSLLVKFGQALEDCGSNVPRLLGKEKR